VLQQVVNRRSSTLPQQIRPKTVDADNDYAIDAHGGPWRGGRERSDGGNHAAPSEENHCGTQSERQPCTNRARRANTKGRVLPPKARVYRHEIFSVVYLT
jgi:hypothetical protein